MKTIARGVFVRLEHGSGNLRIARDGDGLVGNIDVELGVLLDLDEIGVLASSSPIIFNANKKATHHQESAEQGTLLFVSARRGRVALRTRGWAALLWKSLIWASHRLKIQTSLPHQSLINKSDSGPFGLNPVDRN